MKTVVILIVCAAVVAAAAVFGVLLYKNRTGTLTSSLISISFTSAGGMEGGHDIASVTYDPEKQRAWVEIRQQETHSAKEHVTKKEVGEDCIRALEEILAGKDVRAWHDLPPAEEVLLDADTVSVSIQYEDGTYTSFSETQDLPEEAYDVMRELRNCMRRYAGIEEK